MMVALSKLFSYATVGLIGCYWIPVLTLGLRVFGISFPMILRFRQGLPFKMYQAYVHVKKKQLSINM